MIRQTKTVARRKRTERPVYCRHCIRRVEFRQTKSGWVALEPESLIRHRCQPEAA